MAYCRFNTMVLYARYVIFRYEFHTKIQTFSYKNEVSSINNTDICFNVKISYKSNINDIFKNINPSVIPPKINFLNSNLNQQTIATKIDTNIIGSNGGYSKEDKNKK